MIRRPKIVHLAFAVLTLVSWRALACTCAETLPLPSYEQRVVNAYTEYDAVFLGEVTNVQLYVDPQDTSWGRFKRGTPYEVATLR